MTSFSTMQTMLLSSEAPRTMSRPALERMAVSSTTTGGFPGPAQMARLPESQAALTTRGTAGDDVSRVPLCFISAWALSMVGSARAQIRFSGPPAPTMASLSRLDVPAADLRAPGWTLKTTALPPATMPMPLLITVSVGLVVGVIAPMTPKGARSVMASPPSPVKVSGRSRISVPGVLSAQRRFFWILSSTRPRPGLGDGATGQLGGVLHRGVAHRLDDLAARLEEIDELLVGLVGRRDSAIQSVEDSWPAYDRRRPPGGRMRSRSTRRRERRARRRGRSCRSRARAEALVRSTPDPTSGSPPRRRWHRFVGHRWA